LVFFYENRPDFSKYAQKGNLNFQDEEGKSVFTYAVDYKGMNPEAMSYEGPKQWNWTVAKDGKTYYQTNSGISGTEETISEYRKFVEFTITAKDDEFEPIFVEEYQEYGMTMYRLLDSGRLRHAGVRISDYTAYGHTRGDQQEPRVVQG
jgi:hypothetical protein